jgi:hypothetical protein
MFFYSGSSIHDVRIVDLTHRRIIYLDLIKKIENDYKNTSWGVDIKVKSAYLTKKQLILHLYNEEDFKKDYDDIVIYDLVTHGRLFQQSFICSSGSRLIFNPMSTSSDERFTSFIIDVSSGCTSNSPFKPDENHDLAIFDHIKKEFRSLSASESPEKFYGHSVFDTKNQIYVTTYNWYSYYSDSGTYYDETEKYKRLKIKKINILDLSVSVIAELSDTTIMIPGAFPYEDGRFNNLQLSPQGDKLYLIAYVKKNDSISEGSENRSILSYDIKNGQVSVHSQNIGNSAFVISPSSFIYYYQEYGPVNDRLYRLMKSDLNFERNDILVDNLFSQTQYLGVNADESLILAGTAWGRKVFAMDAKKGELKQDLKLYVENNVFYFVNTGQEVTHLQLMPKVLTPPLEKVIITKVFLKDECQGKKWINNVPYLYFLLKNKGNTEAKNIKVGLIQHTEFRTPDDIRRDIFSPFSGFSPNVIIPEIKSNKSMEACFQDQYQNQFFSPYDFSNQGITLVIEQTDTQIQPFADRTFYFERVPDEID